MKVIRLSRDVVAAEPCVATIGFFDGVHRGHQHLIRQVAETAQALGLGSTVITFDRHPRQVVKTDFRPRLLSTLDEKLQLLAATGIDRCAVVAFDERMASLTARDFMQTVLRDQLDVRTLIIGYDNRFGHNRTDGFDDYVRYGREMGMDVRQATPFVLDGVNVSSSVIRSLLQEGEVGMASMCLGRDYMIAGTVASGEHIGTKIGYPTANLQIGDGMKLVPAAGVYAVAACVGGDERPRAAMLNIGTRPTFGGDHTTIEAHLLRFSGDIYGQAMSVAFVKRLREERRFRNAAELACQLKRDAVEAENVFNGIKGNAS